MYMNFIDSYEKMIEPLETQFTAENGKKRLTCAPAICGSRYGENTVRLMYVGRAVNGWEHEWDARESAEIARLALKNNFELKSIANDPVQGTYNFNMSAFWQLCREIQFQLGVKKDWSDSIVWSNLYKIAPFSAGNPGKRLIAKVIAPCIEIFQKEIAVYRPTHIVCVTDAWWFDPKGGTIKYSFADALGIPVKHNGESMVVGKGTYELMDQRVKIVITKRPEMSKVNRIDHAKSILDAFASLDA